MISCFIKSPETLPFSSVITHFVTPIAVLHFLSPMAQSSCEQRNRMGRCSILRLIKPVRTPNLRCAHSSTSIKFCSPLSLFKSACLYVGVGESAFFMQLRYLHATIRTSLCVRPSLCVRASLRASFSCAHEIADRHYRQDAYSSIKQSNYTRHTWNSSHSLR